MFPPSEDHQYISKDDKYDGCLASIKLYLEQQQANPPRALLSLDISFGQAHDTFEYEDENFRVRFGIKFGILYLRLVNLDMPQTARQNPQGEGIGLRIACIGMNDYQWQFESLNNNNVMFGNLTQQPLGTVTINNSSFSVETIFAGAGLRDLIITEQDNLWDDNTDKKKKVTTTKAVKKFLLSQIEDYISRCSIQVHESTDI